MRVEVKTSALARCTRIAPPSSLQGSAALHSVLHKREPILDFHASAPRLIKFQDPRQHTMVQLEDLVHVVMPATFPQNQHHSMSIWQKRTCKPHPSYVGTKKKFKTKIKTKKNCTHRSMWFVNNQSSSMEQKESFLLILSHYLYDQDCRGSVFNCIHPEFFFFFFFLLHCVRKKKSSLNSLKLFCILFPFLKSSEEKKNNIWYQHGFLVIFLEYIQYFLKKEIIHTLHMAIMKQK